MGQNGMSSDVHQSLIDNLLYCPELKNNLHLLMMIRRKWHTWHCYTDMSWSCEGINVWYILYHILYMIELDINTFLFVRSHRIIQLIPNLGLNPRPSESIISRCLCSISVSSAFSISLWWLFLMKVSRNRVALKLYDLYCISYTVWVIHTTASINDLKVNPNQSTRKAIPDPWKNEVNIIMAIHVDKNECIWGISLWSGIRGQST